MTGFRGAGVVLMMVVVGLAGCSKAPSIHEEPEAPVATETRSLSWRAENITHPVAGVFEFSLAKKTECQGYVAVKGWSEGGSLFQAFVELDGSPNHAYVFTLGPRVALDANPVLDRRDAAELTNVGTNYTFDLAGVQSVTVRWAAVFDESPTGEPSPRFQAGASCASPFEEYRVGRARNATMFTATGMDGDAGVDVLGFASLSVGDAWTGAIHGQDVQYVSLIPSEGSFVIDHGAGKESCGPDPTAHASVVLRIAEELPICTAQLPSGELTATLEGIHAGWRWHGFIAGYDYDLDTDVTWRHIPES